MSPVAYVEHSPFQFNNFIYKVDLATPALPSVFSASQPCTTLPPPEGVLTLIVRLSNPLAEGLNNANRVQNEVAAQYIARQSINNAKLDPVVPAIYAWAPCKYPDVADEAGFAWTMCEFKSGEDLDGQFPDLSLQDAISVVEQIADLFVAVQSSSLPTAVAGFGALTIDQSGGIISGQMPLLPGGPWETYAEVWIAKLKIQLQDADKSSLLAGWRTGDTRRKVDSFVESGGVQNTLKGISGDQRVLIHGDLSTWFPFQATSRRTWANRNPVAMNNMLYDKDTKRITCLLDFDWSAVTHPCEEFLFGLWDIGGGIHERVGNLQPMVLSGDFTTPPLADMSDQDMRKWKIAKACDEALAQRGAIRPSSIPGVDGIKCLKTLEDLICPFALAHEVMLKRMSEDERAKRRADTEAELIKTLDDMEARFGRR